MSENWRRFVVDFDGVIAGYKGWTGVKPSEPPVHGAKEFVQWLIDQGYTPVIMSSRCLHPGGVEAIREYLFEHGFPVVDYITSSKVAASFYVDDRGVRFEGDFEVIKDFVQKNHKGIPWERRPPAQV